MAVSIYPFPISPFGHPGWGGYTLEFYEAGSSTPKAVYDSAGISIGTSVSLDSSGFLDIRGSGTYKVVVKDADGNTLYTLDNMGQSDDNLASISTDSFTGDGSTTAFTLSSSAVNNSSLLVTVGGVPQQPGVAYTVSATTLTFTEAPPNGVVIWVTNFGYAKGVVTNISYEDLLWPIRSIETINVTTNYHWDDARRYDDGAPELTISAGAVTIFAPYHTIDTQGDAASDDLDTINGADFEGQRLYLTANNTARTVVLKHGTGNLILDKSVDCSLDSTEAIVVLMWDGTNWQELSRKSNTTVSTPAELTISSGAITVTQAYHHIDTESDAATDDLDTINGADYAGQVVTLSAENSSRVVTIKHADGNVRLDNGVDAVLDSSNDVINLIWDGANWNEQSRSNIPSTDTPLELTIATGAITVSQNFHTVDTESDAASDDLDTINGGQHIGFRITLMANNDARTVVVKHGTGNIYLSGAADFSLDSNLDTIELLWTGAAWVQISSSSNG